VCFAINVTGVANAVLQLAIVLIKKLSTAIVHLTEKNNNCKNGLFIVMCPIVNTKVVD